MMRIVPSRKYAAFVLTVEGHKPRPLFYLILNPPGMQTAVKVLAEYLSFKTDASRADVVSEARALGLGFRTEPPDPANSWPTVLLKTLTTEGMLENFGDYLLPVPVTISETPCCL
jgi:hypothetical protein